ncbi:hypothetical protein BOW53_11935 [Solemya pervernicosa gill symbiont]|uniref:HDOD domain-containing protein n=1 Tax=Solemya pervernicosa gill symbiont TaxID=642797 RepID=A0A1T2L2Q3_9GAMM|nr:HDOD domain-containing protein [Solemya pervernicosa gill symbiont]OOZ39359.1 hypothetical protein BOW53_11935 [Solemya pervernicosa gill symbiont]
MSLDPEELVKRTRQISSLPVIYRRLDEAINDPYSDLMSVANILSEDAALSARLLRVANSAMFSFPAAVDTISRAITIIGTKQLRDLVLATSVIDMFEGVPEEYVNMDSFWRHSIATGISARVVAAYRRESNVERFYVVGLLHDIGRLVMYLQIPVLANEAIQYSMTNGLPLYRAERELIGFDHTDVGHSLLKAWNLPESLQEAVGNHHTPMRSSRYPEDTAVVHFSDIIANAFQMGSSGEHTVPPLDNGAWEKSGIQPSLLPTVVERIESQYQDAVEIFL